MPVIEYTLTESEFLEYNFYTGWQAPDRKNYRLKYYFSNLALFVVMTSVILFAMDSGKIRASSLLIIGIGVVVLFLLVRYRVRAIFDKQGRSLIERSGANSVLSRTMLNISENGLFGKTDVAEVKYTWNAFQKKLVVNKCYYLYLNAKQAVVIPLRAFSNESDKKEFERLLLAHFPLQSTFDELKR
ncbi:MAG: YcxB family protein [Chitinophagaceae bacterium]|nr:YcxB family protein [Chitinophagaceae bacterium]